MSPFLLLLEAFTNRSEAEGGRKKVETSGEKEKRRKGKRGGTEGKRKDEMG